MFRVREREELMERMNAVKPRIWGERAERKWREEATDWFASWRRRKWCLASSGRSLFLEREVQFTPLNLSQSSLSNPYIWVGSSFIP
jgi:hypothetical protein